MEKATILLVEDHEVVREGLRALIESDSELEVVAEAGDGLEAVDLARKHEPAVIVMDLWLPRLSGIEATRRIVTGRPESRVLVLSQHDDGRHVLDALQAGAAGYLVKTTSSSQLLSALHTVIDGNRFLSSAVAGWVVDAVTSDAAPGSGSTLAGLSGREREVLQLIGEGLSSKEIGAILKVSTRTVESHRARLMGKLGIHNVSGLVRFAIREGVIQP